MRELPNQGRDTALLDVPRPDETRTTTPQLGMKTLAIVITITAAVLAWAPRTMAHPLPRAWLHAALCIHQHEGSWRDTTAPYYGGMQMDYRFMRTYGPRLLRRYGVAGHWTPSQQLHVSYRAWLQRGWYPWPTTARMCGLI